MTDKMLLRKANGVAYIVFNNPEKHNAVSQEMWAAIPGFFDEIENDPEMRVVVLTGAGGKSFVAGADISEFEKNRNSVESARQYSEVSDLARTRLAKTLKPTIAMIRGYCIGGGLAVALNCDIRIATEGSRFGVPAARLGIAYSAESIRPLMALVGPAITKEFLYTARQYTATEALRMGLLNHVTTDDQLEAYVADMTASIADNAPLSLGAGKQIVDELQKVSPDMSFCSRLVDGCIASNDYAEGRRAFMEKRKPKFIGR